MNFIGVILSFLIYTGDYDWDEGIVVARTCEQAETWLRAGLRDGQRFEVRACEPYTPEKANEGRGG